MTGSVRVRIDHKVCVMSGQCYYLFDDLVRMLDDGRPELIATDYGPSHLDRLEALAENCPASAIIVE